MRKTIDSIGIGFAATALLVLGCGTVVGKETEDSHDKEDVKLKVIRVSPTGYEPASITKESKEGEVYFKELNCMACHSIHNTGGTLGPMLDGVGAHRSREFLRARLEKSAEAESLFQKLVGGQPRSHVRISPDKAQKIADYLMTVPEPAGGFIVTPHVMQIPNGDTPPVEDYKPEKPTASSKEGEEIYISSGCMACHQIGNMGGWMGPKLDGIGGKLKREELMTQITRPSARAADTLDGKKKSAMPVSSLPEKDVRKIVDYLMTLPPASKQ